MCQKVFISFSCFTYAALFLFITAADATSSEDEELFVSSEYVNETLHWTTKLRNCLDDDTWFISTVVGVVGPAHKLIKRFHGHHHPQEIIITMLKISVCSFEHNAGSLDINIANLAKIIETIEACDHEDIWKFMENLLEIFEENPAVGSFLLSKIASCREDFILKMVLFVELLVDKNCRHETAKLYIEILMEIYKECHIYADMILDILVKLVRYSPRATTHNLQRAIRLFLNVCKYMMDEHLDDVLVQILEIFTTTTECFRNCRHAFREVLELFCLVLEKILATRCEILLFQFCDTMEKLVCKNNVDRDYQNYFNFK